MVVIFRFAIEQPEKRRLNLPGNGTATIVADGNVVNLTHRRDLYRGTCEKGLVGAVKLFA